MCIKEYTKNMADRYNIYLAGRAEEAWKKIPPKQRSKWVERKLLEESKPKEVSYGDIV